MKLLEDLKRNFQKDGTNEWHRGKIISSIVVVFALLLFIIYKSDDLRDKAADRAKNRMYTIGLTGVKNHNFKSSQPTVRYFYEVGNKEYSNIEHIAAQFETSVKVNGGRYYVEFSSANPSNSKLLLDYPVPDSIIVATNGGWAFMPGYKND